VGPCPEDLDSGEEEEVVLNFQGLEGKMMGERCNSNEEDPFQSSGHRSSTVGENQAFDPGTRQTTHLLQRMADEEEECRRLQVQDEIMRQRRIVVIGRTLEGGTCGKPLAGTNAPLPDNG
jgi:hypothetical protein